MQTKRRVLTEQRKTDLREAASVLVGFLCAVLLTRVRIHALHVPLALGLLLGSVLSGIECYGILGGVVLGSLLESPPLWQTILASVLFTAAGRIVVWRKKALKPRFALLLFVASCLASLPLLLLENWKELLYGAGSEVLAVAFGLCVRRGIRSLKTLSDDRLLTDPEQIMLILSAGALLLGMSEAKLFGWSLSVSLLLVLTSIFVSVRGIFGAAAGTFWASLLVLYADADPALIGCVALGASVGAVLNRYGKPMIAAAFLLSAALFQSLLTEDALALNVQNLLCGTLFYLLIPRAWIERIRLRVDGGIRIEQANRLAIERIEQNASEELLRMGRLLSGFSGMFRTAVQDDDAVRRWTVQGALAVCQGCPKRPMCWKDAQAMEDAVCRMAEMADQNRDPKPSAPMDPGCRRFQDLCAFSLLAYQQAQSRNIVCERAKEQGTLVDRQFTGVGDALIGYAKRMRGRDRETDVLHSGIRDALRETGVHVTAVDQYETDDAEILSLTVQRPIRVSKAELRHAAERACGFPLRLVRQTKEQTNATLVFERDTALHTSMRVFRSCDSGEVSGDAAGECRLIGGHVCFALSDGMGSGERARQESEAAIDLLFRLWNAGIGRELIYDNVNRLLLARNDSEIYATLDAVSIDLNTGEAELLKYGAPPCYLLRSGRVRTICGEALPCGILAEAKPSIVRLKLRPNDRLVFCSDGVQDMLPDDPEQAIRSVASANDALGELLLKLAESRGGSDDMTVMVIRVA